MYTAKYFGERWDAPAFDDALKMPVPVGQQCSHCQEAIAEEDSGTWYANGPVVHIECWLRVGLGGINHLAGRCTCHGGTEPPDPPELSRREAALAVKTYVEMGRHLSG